MPPAEVLPGGNKIAYIFSTHKAVSPAIHEIARPVIERKWRGLRPNRCKKCLDVMRSDRLLRQLK
jgi:hypothetical protein